MTAFGGVLFMSRFTRRILTFGATLPEFFSVPLFLPVPFSSPRPYFLLDYVLKGRALMVLLAAGEHDNLENSCAFPLDIHLCSIFCMNLFFFCFVVFLNYFPQAVGRVVKVLFKLQYIHIHKIRQVSASCIMKIGSHRSPVLFSALFDELSLPA